MNRGSISNFIRLLNLTLLADNIRFKYFYFKNRSKNLRFVAEHGDVK